MGLEQRTLYRPRRAVVVVVETRLPNGDHLGMPYRESPDFVKCFRGCLAGGMRMNTRGAPDTGTVHRQLQRFTGVGEMGSDRNEASDAGLCGPTKYRLPVIPEGGVSQMAVTVEVFDHTVAGSGRGFFSPAVPTPKRF